MVNSVLHVNSVKR